MASGGLQHGQHLLYSRICYQQSLTDRELVNVGSKSGEGHPPLSSKGEVSTGHRRWSARASVLVQVRPLPSAPLVSGPYTLCNKLREQLVLGCPVCWPTVRRRYIPCGLTCEEIDETAWCQCCPATG